MPSLLRFSRRLFSRMDLQAKITLVLITVIPVTFLFATVAQHQLTQPVLEEELRQVGLGSAKALASEILSTRSLQRAEPEPALESAIQALLYSQPSIARMDVLVKDPESGSVRMIASSVEQDPGDLPVVKVLHESIVSELITDDAGERFWEIYVPIERRQEAKSARKILGNVHVLVSLGLITRMVGALWRTTATAAVFSVVTLLLSLGYFLRKTIADDRRLREAQNQNLKLSARLHDTERQLMVSEKLAAMGQLTASFAHEIGTPLNAIGGHLQLLGEEMSTDVRETAKLGPRFEIIQGQVSRIEQIVRTFMQNTAQPDSQPQLVDVNAVVDRTLSVVHPQLQALGVELKPDQDRSMGPVRMVPIELEQILLNIFNNSIDSLKTKASLKNASSLLRSRLLLEVETRTTLGEDGTEWAEISVYDTGEGISRVALKNVTKPFFTTKRPGEGTGLGLTICQELAHKYGGMLEIDSRKNSWARVALRIPYRRGT